MVFKVRDIDDTQAPLLDHLIELRTRLLRAVMALGVSFAVCLYFAGDIFGLLVRPLTAAFPPGQGSTASHRASIRSGRETTARRCS